MTPVDQPPLPPPSVPADAAARDAQNLRLLGTFHWVWAGLGLFGIGFLALHYALMRPMFTPEFLARQKDPPPPEMMAMFEHFVWFYVAMGALLLLGMALNVLAGHWLRTRRHWTFCCVVAGLNTLSVPLGTLLGVFTLVVLTKDRVRDTFA